jgi:peroxiredoxin
MDAVARNVRTGLGALVLLGACTSGSVPGERGDEARPVTEGVELIGTRPPEWTATTWFNSPPLRLADLRGKVVLVRWFMSPACPYCTATAPSLNLFDARSRERGLAVIGMYHHKGKEPLDPEAVRGYAAHFGFRFPIGIDGGWATLERWWLDRDRPFTSVSFLLDREGVIRHIHPGGTFAPGDADFREMQRRIEALL